MTSLIADRVSPAVFDAGCKPAFFGDLRHNTVRRLNYISRDFYLHAIMPRLCAVHDDGRPRGSCVITMRRLRLNFIPPAAGSNSRAENSIAVIRFFANFRLAIISVRSVFTHSATCISLATNLFQGRLLPDIRQQFPDRIQILTCRRVNVLGAGISPARSTTSTPIRLSLKCRQPITRPSRRQRRLHRSYPN